MKLDDAILSCRYVSLLATQCQLVAKNLGNVKQSVTAALISTCSATDAETSLTCAVPFLDKSFKSLQSRTQHANLSDPKRLLSYQEAVTSP